VAGDEAEGVGEAEFELAAQSGNVQVTGTGGGLNCRTSNSMSGSVITVVSDGSKLTVRGSRSGDWLPVVCANRNGWVYASYTKTTGTSTSDTAGPSSESTGGTSSVTGTAKVSANGDGLRCRQNPNYDGKIITVLAHGSTVSLRGEQRGDWQPVFCNGQKGHVFAQYLSNRSSSTSGGDSTSGGSGSASFSSGSLAVVTGTGGAGVRLRAAKSTSSAIVTVVGEGKTVQVTSGSSSTWIAVSFNGNNGFISADYLKPTSNSGTSGNPATGNDSGTTTFRLQIGDKAVTLASVNLRYGSSLSTGVAAVVPAGTVIKITGSPKNGFYPSNWDGLKGYIYTDFLRKTDQPVSIRGGSGTVAPTPTPTPAPAPGGGGGSATGQAITNFAMQYVGYPYVWATHGPGSFDCSGFTSWVIKNVLGLNIGYSVPPQFNFGVGVSRSNLQPGDVVFFENTYTFGLSHVGIYIGNNQFVHAENPSTGVVVSDLNSNYYSTRFYGARRMG
jgi:cell wall-associated NlpC family hydrolase